jgi:hypothetical protein
MFDFLTALIIASLQREYVRFPSIEERKEIANEFSGETGFPPVICGLIDGTHIEIK